MSSKKSHAKAKAPAKVAAPVTEEEKTKKFVDSAFIVENFDANKKEWVKLLTKAEIAIAEEHEVDTEKMYLNILVGKFETGRISADKF
jgi:hypothetical protein